MKIEILSLPILIFNVRTRILGGLIENLLASITRGWLCSFRKCVVCSVVCKNSGKKNAAYGYDYSQGIGMEFKEVMVYKSSELKISKLAVTCCV